MDKNGFQRVAILLLVIIAVTNVVIVINGVLNKPVTIGDYMDLAEIKDDTVRGEAYNILNRRIPVVRIEGGKVRIEGEVDVVGDVNVTGGNIDVNDIDSVLKCFVVN